MIKYGRSIRWENDLKKEIEFSKQNGFDFMQVWYFNGNIVLDGVDEPKEVALKESHFPFIIHALLDINDFEKYIPKLLKILKYLEHNEVIVHPICRSEEITGSTMIKLTQKVTFANSLLKENGISLLIENNSKLDPINYTAEEVGYMFSVNSEVEMLLDVAHIDDYKHLYDLVNIKEPKALHIADKHFNCIHEHLPIGRGQIDYNYIFKDVLHSFDGKIIFEIVDEDNEIIRSKNIIKSILEEI